MSKFYVVDSTIKKNGKNPVMLFGETYQLIQHLESMCKRRFGQSRKEYMSASESLGFGGDEQTGRSFFEQMEQYFNMGVIRKDSTPMKCNIFEADRFSKIKDAHGD